MQFDRLTLRSFACGIGDTTLGGRYLREAGIKSGLIGKLVCVYQEKPLGTAQTAISSGSAKNAKVQALA